MISVYTKDVKFVKEYNLIIKAYLDDIDHSTYTYTQTIKVMLGDTYPKFITPLVDQIVVVGSTLIYNLPSYYDIGGSSIQINLFINSGDASSLVKLIDSSIIIQPP
jgi:hypothetical protein